MNRKTRMLTRGLAAALAATGTMALAAPVLGQSNIDPDHKYAWQENCGWLNWRDGQATYPESADLRERLAIADGGALQKFVEGKWSLEAALDTDLSFLDAEGSSP